MLVYDAKLGLAIQAFEIQPASIRRYDDVAFVADCLMPADVDGIAIRHYSFADRWWSANVSLDLEGNLTTAFGPDGGYTYDCDITTPHFEAFGALCNIDLKLDVFLRSDGREHVVTDQDDFAEAFAAGWIDDHDRRAAHAGLRELQNMIEDDELVAFLNEVCPIGPLHDAAEVVLRGFRSLDEIPMLEYWREHREGLGFGL